MSIHVGQIGVGYWGPNLLRNLVSNRDCVVKTVADLSISRRQYVKELYPSIIVTSDLVEIINDNDIEAVIIATPVATHFDLAIKALNAGKHILVEKPMATTVVEMEEIEKLSREKGLVAMVGHTFLFNSAVRYIKFLIDDGILGDIRYIYSQRVNLGRIRSDVDALWNLAPHDISIIQYWLGDPEPISIFRTGMDYVQKGVDDVVFLNILYPNNVLANIHVSWLDPHKIRKMTVVGSKKMVVYDDVKENKVMVYDKGIDLMAKVGQRMDFDQERSFELIHRSGDIFMPKIDWVEPLRNEISHFIDCVRNDVDCLTGPAHAKKVISILERGN